MPAAPIQVVLADERSTVAREPSPWTAGFAISNAGLIVLFPSRSPVYPHDTLEDVLRHEVAHAQSRAYSLSAAFVRDIIRDHGATAPASILRLVAEEVPFDRAVATVAGQPLGAVEDGFWDRQRVWTVWLPMVTSGEAFWLGVIVLAALAVWRRRRHGAQIRRRWEEEERAAAERDREAVNSDLTQ